TPVRRHEAPHAATVVPSFEVVVSGFCISFFAGEVVFGGVNARGITGQADGGQGVAEGQTDPAHFDLAGDVGLHALGAERVGQLVVKAAIAAVIVISCCKS